MVNLGLNASGGSSGTGIDVTAMVDQIIASESGVQTAWKQQQALLATQAVDLHALSSGMTALQDKIAALKSVAGALNGQAVTISDTSLVSATAQSTAASGTHTLVVKKLATTSSYYTDPVASSSTELASGTVTLSVGGSSSDIVIDSTNNTMDKLASYINAGTYGVQASVINDVGGSRLALVSKTIGGAGDLNVTANTSGLVFTKSADGANASFTLDGVPLSSSTNTVTSVLPGVTLNLLAEAPSTTIKLEIGPDASGASSAIKSFVSAYNTVIKAINTQFQTDSSANAGSLATNASMRDIQASVFGDVTYSITGNNGIVNLASMGVNMNNDGTLTVDDTKLTAALKTNTAAVQTFFQTANGKGFAGAFDENLDVMNDSIQGIVPLNINENSRNLRDIQRRITDFEDKLTVRRAQLTKQYSQIDTMLRQYPLLIAQINGALGSLPTITK